MKFPGTSAARPWCAALTLTALPVCGQALQQSIVATQLDSPVAMAIAGDGRLFVTQQGGAVRVIKDDLLLPQPFVVVPTVANDEEGLTGIALDPLFAQNGYVYLRVTVDQPTRHNRIVRYTATGDVAAAGSATTLFDLDSHQAHFHVGSAMHFGPDGRLYLATGDNDTPFFAGNLGTLHGKMLRLAADGTIPTDNPFFATATGTARATFAYGLRNTFAFAIDPTTGLLLANDVGSSQYEEINQILPGGNYGWPASEGPSGAGSWPLFAYTHAGGNCAITGGSFYAPAVPQLGAALVGKYLFAEYCRGELRVLDPQAPQTASVLLTTVAPGPVDVITAPDGSVYYLTRGNTAGSGGTGIRTGSLVKVTAAGTLVPTFTTYGAGCAGALGVPYLRANSAPRLGNAAFQILIGNALPFTAGALQLGASSTASPLGPLPIDLTPLGLTGCRLLQSGDELRIVYNGGGNEMAIPLPIPGQTALLGVPVYLQGIALDPAANAFGGVLTPGTAARIGT